MIPLSGRLVLPAVLACAVAAVPVWLHAANAKSWAPCGLATVPLPEGSQPVRDRSDPAGGRFQWLEGRVTDPDHRIDVRIVRTTKPEQLLGSPTWYVESQTFPDRRASLHWVEVDGTRLPIHQRFAEIEYHDRVAAYLYVVGDRPSASPLSGSLAVAGPQLVRGTQPMTLFLVDAIGMKGEREALGEAADRWLAEAWRSLRRVCAP